MKLLKVFVLNKFINCKVKLENTFIFNLLQNYMSLLIYLIVCIFNVALPWPHGLSPPHEPLLGSLGRAGSWQPY